MLKFYSGFLVGVALMACFAFCYDMGARKPYIYTGESALPVAYGDIDEYFPPDAEYSDLKIPLPPELPCFKLKSDVSCEIEKAMNGI